MPIGKKRNLIYHAALPLLGRRCGWRPAGKGRTLRVEKLLHRYHAAGACVQIYEKGRLTDCVSAGYAAPGRAVTPETVFRTASLAKTITALLVMRLQTEGKLQIGEDISEYWGEEIRSPYAPKAPVTLGMLMSHTSGIVDSQAYFASFARPESVSVLLRDQAAWRNAVPGTAFKYSNLGAGLIGCLLEKLTGESLPELARKELFEPLRLDASYDLSAMKPDRLASSWRVLPSALAFDAPARIAAAEAMPQPAPEKHYLLASGSAFITAPSLAKLALTAWNGGSGFLNAEALQELQTPLFGWPEPEIRMNHGMGLFRIDDEQVSAGPVWGHQGFAYGAVNGLFFDREGNGFAMLNSGISEERTGHLARVNLELLRAVLPGEAAQ